MPHAHPSGFPLHAWDCADDGKGQVFPPPYDEGGLSAAAAPGGAPSYCIETGRSLLRGFRKHPQIMNHSSETELAPTA